MQIIVVSPNPAESIALQQLLGDDGHQVAAVATFGEALELVVNHRANLIIADVQTVQSDGRALMRELSDRGSVARLILLSSRAHPASVADGVVCLTKPVVLAQLQRQIAFAEQSESSTNDRASAAHHH